MNNIRFLLILYSVLYINTGFCRNSQNEKTSNTIVQENKTVYTSKIFVAKNHTYGYDIYANDKLIIHQPTIPSVPGNDGFKTNKDAEKVAGLVKEKLEAGNNFPTVTKEELERLGVVR